MTFNLVHGGGIQRDMRKLGDEPATDEYATPFGTEAYGVSGTCYRWLKHTNTVHLYRPWVTNAPPVQTTPAMPTVIVMHSPNYWEGRDGHSPIALVIHTMAGTLAGSDAWLTNPESAVSAHFGIGLGGQVHRYVHPTDTAWSNGLLEPGNRWPGPSGINPNRLTLSIETEDRGNPHQPVTEAQYAATLGIGRYLKSLYPSLRYLLRHADITPRSRAGCPGARWTESGRFAQLAGALGLETLV